MYIKVVAREYQIKAFFFTVRKYMKHSELLEKLLLVWAPQSKSCTIEMY